ncbi:MAG: antibiotic biosynthesis monooxygenase [Candidatus Tectomicrobia bacterium]|uniref:Antibiotic biosynthesis monooxygenase n=1 Tax=Tectimicrobiota bacterium TaxID=2528274 RepID=A0A932FZ21_UNCTE|nr:antibiotic biosynthesis monooxygenase [Candidatus Tectomicrobia bacterium]
MFTRIFSATVNKAMKMEAQEIIDEAILQVKDLPGFLLLQYLEGEDDLIVITTWSSSEAMDAYANSALAKEIHSRLAPYLHGQPAIRSYAVKTNINGMW